MRQWVFDISKHTAAEISEAVKDPKWQAFRKSLKGIPTTDKLDKLHDWIVQHRDAQSIVPRLIRVQVENYINALKRGGQLDQYNQVVR